MKTSTLLFTTAILFFMNTAHAQIGAKTQGKIHGTWVNSDMGFQMTLILNADGSGEFDGESIRFSTQGDKLSVTQDGVSTTYTFPLQGNSLKLAGGDLDQPITFNRQGAVTPKESSHAASQSTASPKNLNGIWSGYNETIEFKNGNECIYQGQTYPFTITGNTINLQTSQGGFPIPYAVAGNQLTLTVNGQSLVYTKGGATSQSTQSAGKSVKGNLDLTLVGQWCYVNVYSSNSGGSSTSECITLKGDGTYEYFSESSRSVNTNTVTGGTSSQNSDRGTWWSEGNRIHYNSYTNGQGSYQLEKRNHPKNNDPMIVLEGRTYVTATLKNPW